MKQNITRLELTFSSLLFFVLVVPDLTPDRLETLGFSTAVRQSRGHQEQEQYDDVPSPYLDDSHCMELETASGTHCRCKRLTVPDETDEDENESC